MSDTIPTPVSLILERQDWLDQRMDALVEAIGSMTHGINTRLDDITTRLDVIETRLMRIETATRVLQGELVTSLNLMLGLQQETARAYRRIDYIEQHDRE
jgi:hypothetical protein